MGNSSSFEKQVYDAAASNDSTTLQKLLDQLQSQQPAVGRGLLAFRDGDGRTPLIVAAAKNHERCVHLLLQHGACVHCMNRLAEAKGGTALHEAARNGNTHAVVCELLLQYGANPFVANPAGRTPLEEAMLAGSSAIMDRMRSRAWWLGMVAIKSTGNGEYKDRYVAVVPHFPCHALRSCSRIVMPNPKGKQLWVFEDNKSLNPSCRVLLDGATCLWATSTDVILRLHPSHKEPEGDMVARCDHGYCLLLRPVSSSPAAQADLHALVASTDPLALKSSNATAPASHPNPPGPRPPDPSGPRPPTPSVSRVEGGAGSSRGGNVSVPEGGRSSRVGSGGGPEGAGAPSAQAPMGWEQEWTEQLEALPGESDLEFAVRLASAMEVQQGHGQEGHVQSPPPQAPAPPPLVSQPQGASPSAPAGSSGHSGPPSRPTPQTQPSLTYADLVAPPAKWVEPSAPTLTEEEEDSQLFCVVCLSAPRAVGLLHGSTVHQCVCRECAARIETGIMLCPLCRQTVERVLDVYE